MSTAGVIERSAIAAGSEQDPVMPLTAHLVELRSRIIAGLSIWAVGAGVAFFFCDRLLDWLARPAGSLVFTAPAEAFHARVRLAFYGGFLLTLPLLLHQVWLFIARALPAVWRRRLLTLVPLSYALFMAGAAAAIFGVMPQAMRFFISFGSDEVRPMITLSSYLSLVETMSLAFGAIFQFPLVLYVLNWMGILDKGRLTPHRRVIYFGFFVIAALFSVEPFGQTALALTAVLLFEASLLAMR